MLIESSSSPQFAPLLCRFVLPLLIVLSGSRGAAAETLKFLTWEDYISPQLVQRFEAEHNVQIEFVYFQHDEERDDLLAASQRGIYDVFILDGQSFRDYKRLDWIAPINAKSVPQLANFDGPWRDIRPEAVGYGVPYGWGTLGIAYRRDLVNEPLTSLQDVFKPQSLLLNKIIMSPQAFELVPSALLALGYPMGYEDANALAEAKKLLLEQRQYVHSYQALELNAQSPLVTGEVLAAQAYSSDALALADFEENIAYVVPREGSPIWVDFLVVSSGSKNKELAYKFLHFFSQTENVKDNMEHTYTANFHSAAIALLPAEIRANETIFHPNFDDLFVLKSPDLRAIRRIMDITRSLNMDKR